MNSIKSLLIFSFIFISLFSIAGQESGRLTILYIEYTEDSDFTDEDKLIINNTLVNRYTSEIAGKLIVNREDADLSNIDELNSSAIFSGGNSWIKLVISGSKNSIDINWTVYDLLNEMVVNTSSFSSSIDDNYLVLQGGFWTPLIDSVEESLSSYYEEKLFSIHALPGTKITGLTENPFFIDETGYMELFLKTEATYRFTALLRGYFIETHSFVLTQDMDAFVLEQEKKIGLDIDINLYEVSFPMVGVGYEVVPDKWYVRTNFVFFQIGFTPLSRNDGNSNPSMFSSIPLIRWELETGYYFHFRRVPLSANLGIGALVRINTNYAVEGFFDLLLPFGCYISGGLDWRVNHNLSISFQYRPTMYIMTIEDYHYATHNGTHLGGPLLIDFRCSYIGVKINF